MNLTTYPSTHGLVLTMRMGAWGCLLNPEVDNHLATSWISKRFHPTTKTMSSTPTSTPTSSLTSMNRHLRATDTIGSPTLLPLPPQWRPGRGPMSVGGNFFSVEGGRRRSSRTSSSNFAAATTTTTTTTTTSHRVNVIPTRDGIGHILDPSMMNVKCMYPTDGATIAQTVQGCGDFFPGQTIQGAKGASSLGFVEKWELRKLATRNKEFNFGIDCPWEDIPCDFMLTVSMDDDMAILWDWLDGFGGIHQDLEKTNNVIYDAATTAAARMTDDRTSESVALEFISELMGHPICTPSNHSDHPDYKQMVVG
jgi:hypothetical protein